MTRPHRIPRLPRRSLALAALLAGALAAQACGRKAATDTAPAATAGGAPGAAAGATALTRPTDVDWILVRLGDQAVLPGPGRRLSQLRLIAADSEAHGQAACNTFRGRFDLDAAGLRFGPLAATRMACPGLEHEQRYLKAIESTSRWAIEGERLILSDASGRVVAEFAAKSGE